MKTKKFFMVLVALFMGSQMAIFAQGKKKERRTESSSVRNRCRKCNVISL